jgi:hypothetical protein
VAGAAANGVPQNINCSYSYNGWFYQNALATSGYKDQSQQESSYGVNDPSWVFETDAAVQKPSQTPLFADGNWVDAAPAEQDHPAVNLYIGSSPTQNAKTEMGRLTLQRHSYNPGSAARAYPSQWTSSSPAGAVDVGLFDGHVELCKLPNLYNFYWHRNWNQSPNTVSIGLPQ